MDLQLHDKVALITGSSSGIGEAIAKQLAREGVKVILHGRKIAGLEKVQEEISDEGGEAAITIGDLTDPDAIAAVSNCALSLYGKVDILVNNAANFPIGNWGKTPISVWNEVYNTSVLGSVQLIEALTPGMRENGWGRVITMASLVADCPPAMGAHYSAAKAAAVTMTCSLAKSLAGTGVTANSIAPGLIRTPMAEPMLKHYARQLDWGNDWDKIEQKVVEEYYINSSKRLGTPEDIAFAVAMLASPLASYINGATLRVDGGANPTIG